MGRKQQFERDVAINAAQSLFWQQGYAATSIRDLGAELNMRPGSLYKAFESKEKLFEEVLDAYERQNRALFERCLASESSPIEGYRLFLKKVALVERPCKSCMLARAAAAMNLPSALKSKAQMMMGQFEQQLVDWLQDLREKQQLRSDAPCVQLARWIQSQMIGIRTLADSGISSAHVEETIDLQMQAIAPWFCNTRE